MSFFRGLGVLIRRSWTLLIGLGIGLSFGAWQWTPLHPGTALFLGCSILLGSAVGRINELERLSSQRAEGGGE